MISDAKLIELSISGFWPGPSESEQDFLSRIKIAQNIKLPPEPVILNIKSKIDQITQEYYGFSMPDLPVSFDDKGLTLWEGAALWIEEHSGLKTPHIQLKRRFKQGRWLFYNLDEIVAHELFHAARITYDQPKYEEILAYSASSNTLHRVVGPLFQNPKESLFFVLLLFVSCALDLFLFDFSFFYFFPLSYVLFLSLRLWFRQKRIKKVKLKLQTLVGYKAKASGILCRLTDKEIDGFSTVTPQEIREYFVTNRQNDLRLTVIFATFES